MNSIHRLFQQKKSGILSVFYTAGFPALNDTVRIAQLLEAAGVDMIEIGIPYSDPIADGPTIQQSNKVSLEGGMNVKVLLAQVAELRKSVKMPVVLMGYFNPVMQYGVERFVKDAATAGADGLIIPDMPMDEYLADFKGLFDAQKLPVAFLISPTTSEERIRKIDAVSDGFIYAVSASSTTGAKESFSAVQLEYFAKLKGMNLKNPFLVGFGVSNKETFLAAGKYGAGAIVGSAFIELLKSSADLPSDIKTFVSRFKG